MKRMEEEIFEYDSSFECVQESDVIIAELIQAKEELTQACHHLQQKLSLANAERCELLLELDTVTGQLTKERSERGQQQPAKKVDPQLELVKKELDELTRVNSSLEKELAGERDKVNNLENDLTTTRTRLTSSAETRLEEVVQVKKEIISLREIIDRNDQVMEAHERRFQEMMNIQMGLEETNAELNDKNEKLEQDMATLIKNTLDCLERERALRGEMADDDDTQQNYQPPIPPTGGLAVYRQTFDAVRNSMSWIQWRRLTIAPKEL